MNMKKHITLLIFVLLLCASLSGCDSSKSRYTEAAGLLEQGDYQGALAIYEELSDYEDSAAKITECKYLLGSSAMESQEWETAISYFYGLDYKDSPDLLEECTREKGMTENADYSFLSDIETSVLDRMETTSTENYDRATVVTKELAYLDKYRNASFFDPTLNGIADRYINGLDIQRESLKNDTTYGQQIEWQRGVVYRYEALADLYRDYGLLADNTDFVGTYVLQCEDQRALLDAYDALEEDIGSQALADDFEWTLDESNYEFFCTLKNNTKYKFSTIFTISYYDAEGVIFETEEAYIENIMPDSSYKVSLYISEPENLNGFSWENYYVDVFY